MFNHPVKYLYTIHCGDTTIPGVWKFALISVGIIFLCERYLKNNFYGILFFSYDGEDQYELEDRAQSRSHAGNHHGRIPIVLVAIFPLVRILQYYTRYAPLFHFFFFHSLWSDIKIVRRRHYTRL